MRSSLHDLGGERVGDDIRGVAVRERDEHDEAGLAFDQRGDRPHAFAHEEVAFPVAGHGAVIGFGGPLLLDTANNRPSGQRGFFAYARIGGNVVNAPAFQILVNT